MENEAKKHDQDTGDPPLKMDNQGASYSSSYNESTPGEIEENRRASLDQQDQQESPQDADQQI